MNKIRIKAKQKRPAAGLAPLPLPIHYRIMAAKTRGCKGFLSFKETEIGKQTRQNGSFLKTKTVITRSLPQLVGGKGHVYSVGAPFAKVFCFLGEGDVTWHRWPIRGHGTHYENVGGWRHMARPHLTGRQFYAWRHQSRDAHLANGRIYCLISRRVSTVGHLGTTLRLKIETRLVLWRQIWRFRWRDVTRVSRDSQWPMRGLWTPYGRLIFHPGRTWVSLLALHLLTGANELFVIVLLFLWSPLGCLQNTFRLLSKIFIVCQDGAGWPRRSAPILC